MTTAFTSAEEAEPTEEETPEMTRHLVREPRPVEGGIQAGFAVVEICDDAIAFENFLYNEEDDPVLTHDPIVVERDAALLAIIPLNEIYNREYKEE